MTRRVYIPEPSPPALTRGIVNGLLITAASAGLSYMIIAAIFGGAA